MTVNEEYFVGEFLAAIPREATVKKTVSTPTTQPWGGAAEHVM